ncbi:response regulator [Candidatus Woesebacteria bacterium]|nr:response regulator [Candidatus Woesebacteria bacterium]
MNIKKVLILEDDLFLVKVIQKKFEKSGHIVSILLDGLKAVETAKSFKPDIILIDLIMPEKDGFTAISELKGDPETANIPIIVASNLSFEEDINKARNLGIIKYFVKSNVDLSGVISYIDSL